MQGEAQKNSPSPKNVNFEPFMPGQSEKIYIVVAVVVRDFTALVVA